MWLQPILSPLARGLTRVYHRLTVSGETVPGSGPVLLVANHPNSLIDPAVVAGVAHRPVRFLAKHTLFAGEVVSWIVRGSGSIPVYRQSDGGDTGNGNRAAFSAVFDALAEGWAVAIFPEGLSHSESRLSPLRTGAARIALGAAERMGSRFPIIPIGLTFERRDHFRSPGLVVIGRPVPWDDLGGGEGDAAAVRTLTSRIDAALREITVNLDDWVDATPVHTAEAVIAAETDASRDPRDRLRRLREITDRLRTLRAGDDHRWRPLARDLERHARRLRSLHLRPEDLRSPPGRRSVARWGARNAPFLGLIGLLIVALGSVIFWPPYRAVAWVVDRARPLRDTRSTYKLVAGLALFPAWWLLLVASATLIQGPGTGAAVAIALPAIGLLTLDLQERWAAALDDARKFRVHRTRPAAVAALAAGQREIAERLLALSVEPPAAPRESATTPP
jgi:glycerol-3-phosphate O-acyltransferase / dihydroxyacetone phosphate acyltransferase